MPSTAGQVVADGEEELVVVVRGTVPEVEEVVADGEEELVVVVRGTIPEVEEVVVTEGLQNTRGLVSKCLGGVAIFNTHLESGSEAFVVVFFLRAASPPPTPPPMAAPRTTTAMMTINAQNPANGKPHIRRLLGGN